jgi:hypothetical protein
MAKGHGQSGVVKCSPDERMERGNLRKSQERDGMHEMKAPSTPCLCISRSPDERIERGEGRGAL